MPCEQATWLRTVTIAIELMPNLLKLLITNIKQSMEIFKKITVLVNLDKLLFPMPKPSTMELFLLTDDPGCERLEALTLSDALTS